MMPGQLDHVLPVLQAFIIALDFLSRMLVGWQSSQHMDYLNTFSSHHQLILQMIVVMVYSSA